MKNHLEKRFKQLIKEIRMLNFKKMVEIEFGVLKNTIFLVDDSVNITTEQFQESNFKKFKQLVKQEEIEKDFNNTINIDKKIDSKELKKELKENLKSVFNTIISGTSKLIEAISFQYNYEPSLSILCWAGGKYEANKTDKYVDLGELNYYIENEINFSDWLIPIINLENKYDLFEEFELGSFSKLKELYYLNFYLNLKQSLFEILEKNIKLKSVFTKQVYFYVNEFDCEQTFLLRFN